ncbi:DUF4276 family protein [Abyssibius alkaniclasticus]|uniref:DUF4276 family protein n=1 Tax=Abyssibius alkaniclasticus TaxID=2881234 RepID=UPI0023642F95|nr:DUF4276 family protein [Abyssibius alkaniclasticus]UPH71956.1 DUF4276 family protein [Abyssibius alkaniclasticus]
MKETLNALLPKLAVDRRDVQIIAFDGVGNMEKSLPAQLRAVSKERDTKVLILRDNDNGNCAEHKARLVEMINRAGLAGRARVRVVCQMLEGWFIGDTNALDSSRHLTKPIPKRLKTCDPDSQPNPKAELRKLRDGYTEIKGAQAIAKHMDPKNNRSKSFRYTVQAIRCLTA